MDIVHGDCTNIDQRHYTDLVHGHCTDTAHIHCTDIAHTVRILRTYTARTLHIDIAHRYCTDFAYSLTPCADCTNRYCIVTVEAHSESSQKTATDRIQIHSVTYRQT